jgi:hypothetical protein
VGGHHAHPRRRQGQGVRRRLGRLPDRGSRHRARAAQDRPVGLAHVKAALDGSAHDDAVVLTTTPPASRC